MKMSRGNTSHALREAVAAHYDSIFHLEAERLAKESPIEFAITTQCITKWGPDNGVVADIGVGVGHYTELMARRGCKLYLADISQRFLDATCANLARAGLGHQIITASRASATQLEQIPSASCDAVLMLGPLYHLWSTEERLTAVEEAARVLKDGGILFAAGINRAAYFRDLLRANLTQVSGRSAFHKQFLLDGNLDSSSAPAIGPAHLTTVADFRSLFGRNFKEISLLGVESFAGPWQQSFHAMPPKEREAWLELVALTASTAEGLGASDHLLFVGSKG